VFNKEIWWDGIIEGGEKKNNLNLSQCWGKISKNEIKIWIHRKISDGRR